MDMRGDESVEMGVREGAGKPGGAERPGGTTGRPGGRAGDASTGSGDNANPSFGGELKGERPCDADAASESTMGVEDRDTSGAIGTGSFCFVAFVPAGVTGRLDVVPLAGVAGRDEEASEGAFAVVEGTFRSRIAVVVLLLAVALEPIRG